MTAATIAEVVRALHAEVVEADARMQLEQLHLWRELGRGDPLLAQLGFAQLGEAFAGPLEGYERHANLGLAAVELTVYLEPEPWLLRLWRRITRRGIGTHLRLAGEGAPVKLSVRIERRPEGALVAETVLSPPLAGPAAQLGASGGARRALPTPR